MAAFGKEAWVGLKLQRSEREGCQQTNGAFLLHAQVLGACRCPGHINQFPTLSFVLGFALTVDILGPVMQHAIFFLLEPSREVIMERTLLKPF